MSEREIHMQKNLSRRLINFIEPHLSLTLNCFRSSPSQITRNSKDTHPNNSAILQYKFCRRYAFTRLECFEGGLVFPVALRKERSRLDAAFLSLLVSKNDANMG